MIWHTADARYVRYEIGDEKSGSEAMASIVNPYKLQLDETMNIVIGELDVDLIKERVESNMGNWYADIILEEANRLSTKKVDFAIQNYGGLRSNSIAAGPITVRTIFEVMPFENTLVTADLTGEKVIQFFNFIADYGGFPVSKGVKFEIQDNKAVNLTLNGEAVDPSKIYRLALSDYIANGGDDASVFKGAEIHEYNILQRDAILNHIKRDTENGIVQSGIKEGRIVKIN